MWPSLCFTSYGVYLSSTSGSQWSRKVELFCQTPQQTIPNTQHQTTSRPESLDIKALYHHSYQHLEPQTFNTPNMPPSQLDPVDKRQAAREVIDILQEISDLLVRSKPALPTPTN